MKYAEILFTVFFNDDECKKTLKVILEENKDEKKQIEDFICSYRNVYHFLNIDFSFLLVDRITVHEEIKNDIDISTLKI